LKQQILLKWIPLEKVIHFVYYKCQALQQHKGLE